MPTRIVIFSSGAGKQQYGLGHDASIIENALRTIVSDAIIEHKSPYLFAGLYTPSVSDVHIYLEVPCRAAFPWAKVNVIIPNAEWWYTRAWSWVVESGAIFWFRSRHCQNLFRNIGVEGTYIGWIVANSRGRLEQTVTDKAIYVVGGSKHKLAAANRIVSIWKATWPRLTVISAAEPPSSMKPHVMWRRTHVSDEEKLDLLATSRIHVVASEAEGFGYTMAEALAHNALILRTDLPVYEELWGNLLGSAGLIKTAVDRGECEMLDPPRIFDAEAVVTAMNTLLKSKPRKLSVIREALANYNSGFSRMMAVAWRALQPALDTGVVWVPPKPVTQPPVIGVITLVHNRPQWFRHAALNIETADYPRERLVWVVVDDGDTGRVDTEIEHYKRYRQDLQIVYVSLAKKTTIGEKRNRGCAAAVSTRPDLSVFACMDDDDHYPVSSLSVRVAWLLASDKGCIYASTLPMYDITRYISAMNVPPLNLSPCERVSEATLCFRRDFWEARGFPDGISVAEGEEFLRGREMATIEMPPNEVIVSFLHGKNFTSRRVPEQSEPNGCHYGFPDQYFTLISQLAGLSV